VLCEASGKEGKDRQRTGKREKVVVATKAGDRTLRTYPQHATTQPRPIHNRFSPLRSTVKISYANVLAFLLALLTQSSIRIGHPCVRFPRLHGE
jgi:hypothetical protein